MKNGLTATRKVEEDETLARNISVKYVIQQKGRERNMSDGITDMLRLEEKDRLNRIDHIKLAERLKELYPSVREYNFKKADLLELGYKIEEVGDNLRIWKEI